MEPGEPAKEDIEEPLVKETLENIDAIDDVPDLSLMSL
jgi:hypothetical protein